MTSEYSGGGNDNVQSSVQNKIHRSTATNGDLVVEGAEKTIKGVRPRQLHIF